MIKEIDGEEYISVKGTAKSYDVHSVTIRDQIRNNSLIFNDHIILEKNAKENFFDVLPKELKYDPKRKWLDKFAFYKMGTLLNSSPITEPIKAW